MDTESTPPPLSPPNIPTRPVYPPIFAIVVILLVGLCFVLIKSIPTINQSPVPDDQTFLKGFTHTGREWPPTEPSWSDALKQNPLTALRKSYCERMGYKYADFAGDCFFYDFSNSYKSYSDTESGITFYYPNLWQADPHPLNYGYIITPKISLKRQGASCILTYGLVDEKKLLSSDKASVKLNKNILSFTKPLSGEEKAAGYTDIKLISAPHFPLTSDKYGFLMTSGNRQPLTEACLDEFDRILNSRSINYPATKLDSNSNGLISLQNISSSFESSAHISDKIGLIFQNSATGQDQIVRMDNTTDIHTLSYPFLSDNNLYFFVSPAPDINIIKSVNIFTGVTSTVPLFYEPTQLIHSFFIKQNLLYYLVGKPCNQYMAVCHDLKLKSYNLKSGISENLAGGITSRQIEGFDVTGNKLILLFNEGDAGCVTGSYQSFILSTKSLKNIGEYSYCEGDSSDSIDKFIGLTSGTGSFNYLVLKNGQIFLPPTDDNQTKGIYFRANLSDYPDQK